MSLAGKRVGVAITGSFCTYDKIFPQLQRLVEEGAEVQPIFSKASQTISSRFGKAEDFMKKAEYITGKQPILTVEAAEPIGPKSLLDLVIIMPCTGNTLAKLANGVTDSCVLMAAKAHLRNDKPVLLFVSTNDALGLNMKNIGTLINAKNIFFVPFGQDSPMSKPNSMVAHAELLIPSAEQAILGKQYQPLILGPFE